MRTKEASLARTTHRSGSQRSCHHGHSRRSEHVSVGHHHLIGGSPPGPSTAAVGVCIGSPDGDTITLTGSGTFVAPSEATEAWAVTGGYVADSNGKRTTCQGAVTFVFANFQSPRRLLPTTSVMPANGPTALLS